jgi:predicted lipoprotein with Yx(FWY)xxD motif
MAYPAYSERGCVRFSAVAVLATTGGAATRKGALVKVNKTSLGRILVDSRGRTLYLFEGDKSRKSMCSGSCATFSGRRSSRRPSRVPAQGSRRSSSVPRSGPALRSQVTYRGHPLYTFKLERAGQTKGEGDTDAGPPFYAVSPAGAAVVK